VGDDVVEIGDLAHPPESSLGKLPSIRAAQSTGGIADVAGGAGRTAHLPWEKTVL